MEWVIRVNRYGRVLIYRMTTRYVQFWGYAKHNSVEWAIGYCRGLPTTILTTNEGL